MEKDVPKFLDALISTLGLKVHAPFPRRPLEDYFEAGDCQRIVDHVIGTIGLKTTVHLVSDERAQPTDTSPHDLRIDRAAIANMPFDWFVANIARELCQLLLNERDHPFKDDPQAPELLAMIFGYQNFVCNAEEYRDNEALRAVIGFVAFAYRKPSLTPQYRREGTRQGNLTSEEAHWAREYLKTKIGPR